MSQVRSVTVPRCEMHEGYPGNAVTVRLHWICPVCGGKRGEPYDTISYDGSRRLGVTGWRNACGHIDFYSDVRQEAVSNGLNTPNKRAPDLGESSASDSESNLAPLPELKPQVYAEPGESASQQSHKTDEVPGEYNV